MTGLPLATGRVARWPRWVAMAGLALGLSTALALFNISQNYFLLNYTEVARSQKIPLTSLVGRSLTDWYLWALMTPLLVWFGRRFPIHGRHWLRHLFLQVGFSGVISILKLGLDIPTIYLFPGKPGPVLPAFELFKILFFADFLVYLIICGVILGASHAVAYYRKYRERELQASQLAAKLAQTQLQVLKMQLHPHFLFNTLHAISALMHKDVELAERMIARLGELLRSTLEHAGTQEVPLRDELEFIQPYLEIERARLGSRLSVHIDVDPGAMDACVPNLLLQPLVENAIRHGIAPKAGAGFIEIMARRQNGHLQLRVRDNGRGLASNYTEGVGVGNTRARLRQLYGLDHEFSMHNRPEGGLEVLVAVPYCEQGDKVMADSKVVIG